MAISRGLLSRIIAQVRLSSEYLWSCEYLAEAIVEVGLFLYDLFGDYLWFQVSEVDLCADVVGVGCLTSQLARLFHLACSR